MTNLVIMKDRQAVTSSLQVADNFEKRHDHILRDIDGVEKDVPNFGEMFFETSEPDSYGRERRVIYMNRDGFTILAMGFTGKKALQFKLKYIEAFNQMEEHIKQQPKFPTTHREQVILALQASEETNQRVDELEKDVSEIKRETTITGSQRRKVSNLVKSTVIRTLGGKRSNAYKDDSIRNKCHKDCYKQLWECFDVASYMDIPKIRFEEAMDLIPRWKPTLELQAHIDAVNGNGNIFDEFF